MKKFVILSALLMLLTPMATYAQNINLSSTTPAAPSGYANVIWQKDNSSPVNISGYVQTSLIGNLNNTTLTSLTGLFAGDGAHLRVATPGMDYVIPSGNVATATALAGTPTNCTGTQFSQGISANGNANCATPTGGGSGTAQTISALTFSPSDSTIVATWYTSGNSNSALTCGGKAAVDNNVQSNVTFHQAIVSGLAPATGYSCAVSSGSTSSTPQTITTLAAATRTPITAVAFGGPTTTTYSGDTIKNCVSNDNLTYVTEDDGSGLGTSTPGRNMQIEVLSNESTITGTPVNLLANYGAASTTNGTDGPSGAPLTNKLSGLFCMSGELFAFQTRAQYGGSQLQWYGNIMKSKDHGLTWNSWQNPPNASAGGVPPNPLGSYQFATKYYGWINPVRYAIDDGSNGYLVPGNRIDGADAWVYMTSTDGFWANSSNLYLMRIARAAMDAQNPGSTQYWIGPTSPTPSDFVNDAYWSTSASSATAVYSAASKVSDQDIVYVPTMNYYLLLTWYYPNISTTGNTVWVALAGPTPAGPWTQIGTQTNNPSGYYGETVLHRTVATNTSTSNVALTLVYGGDYAPGAGYYHPTYSSMILNPADLLNATPAATFAGSVAHALSSTYSGNLVKIERASDSTTLDIGQVTGGAINSAAISTFCSGTTCNVAELYDQSGNGNNCTQSTFSEMPVIYKSGAVVVNGSKGAVSMLWDNTQRWLICSATFSGSTWESVGVGTAVSGIVQYAGLSVLTDGAHSGGAGTATLDLLAFTNTSNASLYRAGITTGNVLTPITLGSQFYYDSGVNLAAGGSGYVSVNGGSFVSNANPTAGTVASTQLSIGADVPKSTYFWDGYISDVVVYPSVLTAPQRSAAHAIESAFFGTP